MKHWILILLFAAYATACGGSAQKSAAYPKASYGAADESSEAPAMPEESRVEGNLIADTEFSFSSKKMDEAIGENKDAPPPPPAEQAPAAPTAEEPMVVYSGFLHLRVRRLIDSVNEITRITTEKGGYVESLSGNLIIVRVPAIDFEGVMEVFSRIGDLLGRRVYASDVTAQFTDLSARLAVAEESRKRLMALLEQTQDVKERLAILQQIKRLSEQIETIQSTLATLKNLVDYFTITLQLEPIVDNTIAVAHLSPFPWIRALEAHQQSILNGMDTFSMSLPSDFVLFDEDDDYRAQSADTTIIRGGTVPNNPVGTSAWWSAAIQHEMTGRGEILEAEGTSGALRFRLYRNDDVQPRFFLIAVHAEGETVWVMEAFYPDRGAFEKHHDDVLKSLSTFKVKP